MKISEARSAAESAGVQLDEPVPLNSDHVSEGGDDRDGGNVEQI